MLTGIYLILITKTKTKISNTDLFLFYIYSVSSKIKPSNTNEEMIKRLYLFEILVNIFTNLRNFNPIFNQQDFFDGFSPTTDSKLM